MAINSKTLRALSRRAGNSIDPRFFLKALAAVAVCAETRALLTVHDIYDFLDVEDVNDFREWGGDLRILGQVMFAARDLGIIENTVLTESSRRPTFHATTRVVWRSRSYKPN